ncbi:hypothetical protein [Massilia sp. 9I]|uniref:hypothetical protein n=1 Tax=Massilia sp. 9I TaxID=2653152 RepID=UPI0012F15562|nr:hypothetical protein [Massilia sp. 9I]VXC64128.1 conserved exported hypothetical protein [Massilia sp. 9I]
MRILASLILSLAIVVPQAAMASPASDALGNCLKDNTSGKDRKDLARWIFVSMSAHPEIRSFAPVNEQIRTGTNKQMADLVTRLLTVNCAAQARAAGQEGPAGMLASFKSLGEVAMMELTSNPSVAESISAYVQFVDRKKIEEALGGK